MAGTLGSHPGSPPVPLPQMRSSLRSALLDEKRPRFSSLNKMRGDSRFKGHWWPRMPSQGGMEISTQEELRKAAISEARPAPSSCTPITIQPGL